MSQIACKELLEALRPVVTDCGARALKAFYAQQLGQTVSGKAAIDEDIETRLHAVVTKLTPTYGFLAEECPAFHRPPAASETRYWLIDPNDGTRPFQQGYRGPSVSIALIEDGLPILGIVYAYAARCGQGDYFEWSDDTALRRNGLYVQWQQACPVALVSNNAELRHDGYQQRVTPLRYQPAPGIAYRLALLAAGRGLIALSLGRPRDLDIAGGHALLIGAGLELYDANGQPVRYTYDQSRIQSTVIGGSLRDCQPILNRLTKDYVKTSAVRPPWYVAPKLGETVQNYEALDRLSGAVVGCLIADSLMQNTALLDCLDQTSWAHDVGQLGQVGGHLVSNLTALLDKPAPEELPHTNPGVISMLPRLLGTPHSEFAAWLSTQDTEVQQFGHWLGHLLYPQSFERKENEIFDELESAVNGAVSFVDGLGLAQEHGVSDRRLLWIATYLGANFGRNALPESMVACLETCRPNTIDSTDRIYLTRPDILVERVLALGALHG